MIRTIAAALAAACLSLTSVQADEAWVNPAGQLIYEADIGHIAVISFPIEAANLGAGERARVYFPGLGGNFDNRSIHEGYWLVDGEPICTNTITTPEGLTSQRWGRALLIWDERAFPSGFTMLLGTCWSEPETRIRASLN